MLGPQCWLQIEQPPLVLLLPAIQLEFLLPLAGVYVSV